MARVLAVSFASLLTTNVAESSLSFLVMGDWGGDQHAPYCTLSEKDTAKGMDRVASQRGSKFALALGDNMYHAGVTSVDDKRFEETFEQVFTGDALSAKAGFKFHLVAGNHDHIGDVNAQVAYSEKNPRWVFPSLYYTFSTKADDGAIVQFVMLDTVIISGNSQIAGENKQLTGDHLTTPLDKATADAQLQWLEQTLSSSSADYLLVGGHYPIHSVCEHGPTKALQDTVKPLLQKYKVTAYLAGHDHCSEHIDTGDGVQYHGIGSAAYDVPSEAHLHTLKPGQLKYHEGIVGGGFASFVVSKQQIVVTHHDGTGNKMYNSTLSPRTNSVVV